MYSASFLPGGLSEGSAFSLDYPQRPGKLPAYGLFSGQAFWAESERHAVTENHPRGKAGLCTDLYGSQVWYHSGGDGGHADGAVMLVDAAVSETSAKLPWHDGRNRKRDGNCYAAYAEYFHAYGMGSNDHSQCSFFVLYRNGHIGNVYDAWIYTQYLSQ